MSFCANDGKKFTLQTVLLYPCQHAVVREDFLVPFVIDITPEFEEFLLGIHCGLVGWFNAGDLGLDLLPICVRGCDERSSKEVVQIKGL